jgi:hypothetical protein
VGSSAEACAAQQSDKVNQHKQRCQCFRPTCIGVTRELEDLPEHVVCYTCPLLVSLQGAEHLFMSRELQNTHFQRSMLLIRPHDTLSRKGKQLTCYECHSLSSAYRTRLLHGPSKLIVCVASIACKAGKQASTDPTLLLNLQ